MYFEEWIEIDRRLTARCLSGQTPLLLPFLTQSYPKVITICHPEAFEG
jgi:hypothetical protein